ncbi:MAG: hypothetical protein R2744_09915 [Bacteroidales bacterium]
MNCHDINSKVIQYLEGTLNESEKALSDDHIKGCSRCQGYLEFVRGSLGQIEVERQYDADDDFTRAILRKIDRVPEKSLRYRLMSVASAAAVIFFAVIAGNNLGRFSATSSSRAPGEGDLNVFFADDISLEPIESFFLLDNNE